MKQKKITIYINSEDYRKIKCIGSKPWPEVNYQEQLDYQKLIEKVGSIAAQVIRNNDL